MTRGKRLKVSLNNATFCGKYKDGVPFNRLHAVLILSESFPFVKIMVL